MATLNVMHEEGSKSFYSDISDMLHVHKKCITIEHNICYCGLTSCEVLRDYKRHVGSPSWGDSSSTLYPRKVWTGISNNVFILATNIAKQPPTLPVNHVRVAVPLLIRDIASVSWHSLEESVALKMINS